MSGRVQLQQDDRYRLLFEPMRIGPVTAPNRFYQVPHCTGMGYARPHTLAAMRGMKAEGGWGVVCTEYCSIHPNSDAGGFHFASLWDDDDIRAMGHTADSIHAHGAIAGLELWHGGSSAANLLSREPTLGVRSMPSHDGPIQSHPMDKADIRNLRKWHRDAALRAKAAGFDIIYVYPTHGYLLHEFLSRSLNGRSDEYGGNLENRVRLVRELIEETRDVVGGTCAVAVRMSANGHGKDHLDETEAHDMMEMLGQMPDLWDMVISDYEEEMATSRFGSEGGLEKYMSYVRSLTGKPVVTVGRFTSPDTMVSQIKNGITDFIGAARPSIADPFLPTKIREGRLEDIRECIGCNICYAQDNMSAPLRCTQNPTMGEEWRRGWHPEKVKKDGEGSVLVVGAGPAGLEAAHILGRRGFDVAVVDAQNHAGGRVTRESKLPGLAEWVRVRDYRMGQISALENVSLYLGSLMTARDIMDYGADQIILATGAKWRADGTGRWHSAPVKSFTHAVVYTPDDIMDGRLPRGRVVIFDDDHYYMAPVLAEALVKAGAKITYVCTAASVCSWGENTQEQFSSQARLIELGVELVLSKAVAEFDGEKVRACCIYTDHETEIAADALVLVTSREPNNGLYRDLLNLGCDETRVSTIGDCHQPSIIAAAIYAGHRVARELGNADPAPVLRERVVPARQTKTA